MIALVTGTPGSGKSFYGVRCIANALDAGKCVATNVELRPDTGEFIASKNVFTRLLRRRPRVANRIDRSYHVADSLDELFSIRLDGDKEGRGVMVLDEAHGWMNARSWSDENRADIVRFFTQHRKLGWDIYLITQDSKNVDRQVRTLAEYEIRVRNLKRLRFAGLPIVPGNFFIAIWSWAGMANTVTKREAFALSWIKNLYNTHQLTHGLSSATPPEGGFVLPRPTAPQARLAEVVEVTPEFPEPPVNPWLASSAGSDLPPRSPSTIDEDNVDDSQASSL